MGWLRDFWRRQLLLRRLAKSDNRFDKLIRRLDKLERLACPTGDEQIKTSIQAGHVELDALEVASAPIEDELRRLDASSPSRWLTNRAVDGAVAVAVVIIPIVRPYALPVLRRVYRIMRRVRSRKKPPTKKPAPPGNDESFQILLSGVAGLVMYGPLFFLGFIFDGDLFWFGEWREWNSDF